jgi:uncharacterized protein (DUF1330 family)
VSSPFPEVNSDYQLQSQGQNYLLTYKEDNADVATTMAQDFAIKDLKVTSSQFDSRIWPTFTRVGSRFLINSYQATYVSGKADERTELQVLIGYQEVQGLQLIESLNLSGSYGGAPFKILVRFSGCTAQKR